MSYSYSPYYSPYSSSAPAPSGGFPSFSTPTYRSPPRRSGSASAISGTSSETGVSRSNSYLGASPPLPSHALAAAAAARSTSLSPTPNLYLSAARSGQGRSLSVPRNPARGSNFFGSGFRPETSWASSGDRVASGNDRWGLSRKSTAEEDDFRNFVKRQDVDWDSCATLIYENDGPLLHDDSKSRKGDAKRDFDLKLEQPWAADMDRHQFEESFDHIKRDEKAGLAPAADTETEYVRQFFHPSFDDGYTDSRSPTPTPRHFTYSQSTTPSSSIAADSTKRRPPTSPYLLRALFSLVSFVALHLFPFSIWTRTLGLRLGIYPALVVTTSTAFVSGTLLHMRRDSIAQVITATRAHPASRELTALLLVVGAAYTCALMTPLTFRVLHQMTTRVPVFGDLAVYMTLLGTSIAFAIISVTGIMFLTWNVTKVVHGAVVNVFRGTGDTKGKGRDFSSDSPPYTNSGSSRSSVMGRGTPPSSTSYRYRTSTTNTTATYDGEDELD
ncbi:hypothetical protein DFS34DRAFT_654795 [Phlyctochytrium arcticum]|nr:hypothetical protein DFS34DRAFT_654795 [Phlyctochytrium arcticum]